LPVFSRARLASAARWLAPSAAAACAGAAIAGTIDGAGMASIPGAIAAAGFVAIIAFPVLFAASAAIRGTWAAWQPRALGDALIEDGGGAPRLAGWAISVILGAMLVAWAAFQSTWMLAWWTAFKPFPVSVAETIVAVGAALVAAALSRPIARAATALLRRLDARWRRTGRRSLLTPGRVALGGTAIGLAIICIAWRIEVQPHLGPVELGVLTGPAAAIATAAIVHALWPRLGRARVVVGGLAGLAAIGAVGTALVAWRASPSLTLEIWGDRPVAGLAIDELFDTGAIRNRIALAQFRPTPRPGAAHPDIIVITIDTVRADHTPPYGGKAVMPVLAALAARGAVFDWAFSPSNVTRRSIPSMFIGLQPDRVHGRVVGWALKVDPRHVMVAERMLAGGYDTAGFMCCEGFWGTQYHTGLERGLAHLEIEPSGVALARKARAWLDERERHPTGRPLFLWMHILEPHNWWHGGPPPPSRADRDRIYDRVLGQVDDMLGIVLGAFDHRASGQGPIIIITADHGEALGDHGQPYHSTDLYDSQTHVPLVIAGPGIAAHRVDETVSGNDLTPTLLDLAGFAPPGDPMDGISIADLATGARAGDPEGGTAFLQMIKDRSNPGGVSAFVRGRWKLIDGPGGLELYDVRTDPDEHANVIGSHAALVKPLLDQLRAHLAAGGRSPFQ
jgi:arylsulfatase A-like enzyme